MLKVAELLVSKEECDSRAEFWVEKAAKLLPGNSAVFNLKVRLLFFSVSSKTFIMHCISKLLKSSKATLLTCIN